jgi:hypothetical protein
VDTKEKSSKKENNNISSLIKELDNKSKGTLYQQKQFSK